MCVFWQNNMASAVENASQKLLEMPFLWLYKFQNIPKRLSPQGTCAFGASSKATYCLLSACYFKIFDSPALNNIFWTFLPGVSRCEIEVFDPQAWHLAGKNYL